METENYGYVDSFIYFASRHGMKESQINKILTVLKNSTEKIKFKKGEMVSKDFSTLPLRQALEPHEFFMVDISFCAGMDCGTEMQKFREQKNRKYDLGMAFALGMIFAGAIGTFLTSI